MIDFSDVTEFETRLRLSPGPLEESWQREWSRKVADGMRARAPIDTGTLRASIQVTADGVVASAPYAGYVEYGTADTSPQPFAGPTVNQLAGPAAEDAGNRVIRGLR